MAEDLRAEIAERLWAIDHDHRGNELEAITLGRACDEFLGLQGGGGLFEGGELLGLLGLFGEEAREALFKLRYGCADFFREGLDTGFLGGDVVVGGLSADGLEAAGAGGDCAFGDDLEETDLAGGVDVGAAAQLAAVTADVDHADSCAILLAEKGEGALGLGVEVCLVALDLGVIEDAPVDDALDLLELRGGDGLEVREVEAHAVGGVERAGLAHVGAEHAAQREVEQMRGGVVALDGAAVHHVHTGFHNGSDERIEEGGGDGRGSFRGCGENAAIQVGDVVQMAAGLVLDRVADLHCLALGEEHAAVADLAAHLGVEGRLVEHEVGVVAGADDLGDGDRVGLGFADDVAGEGRGLGLGGGFALGGGDDDFLLGRGAAAGALLLHELLEPGGVDSEAALGGEQLRHVEREAVGIVELEGVGAADLRGAGGGLVENGEAALDGAAEALLLAADDAADHAALGDELGEHLAEAFDHGFDELLEEAGLQAELGAVEDAAAEDTADDVVAALVAGEDAVGDRAADGARVVGEHAEGDVDVLLIGKALALGGDGALVDFAREPGDLGEEGREDVGVVVGRLGGEVGAVFGRG